MLTRTMVLSDEEQGQMNDWEREVSAEVEAEYKANDPVHRSITYVSFVSKSKGIRNGKRRLRKHWQEVELISYLNGSFRSWDKFQFDVYATEIYGRSAPWDEAAERLKEDIRNLDKGVTI